MERVQPEVRICWADGCTRTDLAGHGLCDRHKKRFVKHGDANHVSPSLKQKIRIHPPGTRICSIEGCNRKHDARGLCKSHYRTYSKRLKRESENRSSLPAYLKTCVVEGCSRPQNTRGLCKPCYGPLREALKSVGAEWSDIEIFNILLAERSVKIRVGVGLYASALNRQRPMPRVEEFISAFPGKVKKCPVPTCTKLVDIDATACYLHSTD